VGRRCGERGRWEGDRQSVAMQLALATVLFAFVLGAQTAYPPVATPSNALFTLQPGNTIQAKCGTATAVTYTIFGTTLLLGTLTPQVLAQGQLATSIGALYTVPASTIAYVTEIVFANATSSAVTGLTLAVNGTAAANDVISSLTLQPNGFAIVNPIVGVKVYDGNGNVFTTRLLAPTGPGGLATLTTPTAGINTTETVVLQYQFPANFNQVGTFVAVDFCFTIVTTNADSAAWRLRWGTAGTTADTVIHDLNVPATGGTGGPVTRCGRFLATWQSATVTETNGILFDGGGSELGNVITGPTNTTGLSTAQAYLDFTFQSGATTTTVTFQQAEISLIHL
jgi:hypothetical protein